MTLSYLYMASLVHLFQETYTASEVHTDALVLRGLDGLDPTFNDPTASQAPLDADTVIKVSQLCMEFKEIFFK